MTDEQEEMVAIPKEVFDLALTKANLELIQKVDTLLNLLMEPASNLPKCFADWQDNHATDRGCGNCDLRSKCQASQPNLEKIADDLQALCDEQALRIGRLEALLAQPEKNFVTIVDGPFNHRCPETPLHIKEALAQPEQEPLFWYRPVGNDGGYEGPIHNRSIEQVRKNSGAWKPLYTTPPQRKPIDLSVIRKWPEGFEPRLQHVWLDVVSFIPNVKLYDLQRVLAEYGFEMQIYEATNSIEEQSC